MPTVRQQNKKSKATGKVKEGYGIFAVSFFSNWANPESASCHFFIESYQDLILLIYSFETYLFHCTKVGPVGKSKM